MASFAASCMAVRDAQASGTFVATSTAEAAYVVPISPREPMLPSGLTQVAGGTDVAPSLPRRAIHIAESSVGGVGAPERHAGDRAHPST